VTWIEEQLQRFGDGPEDKLGRHILGTGLLSYGRLEAIEIILDSMPRPLEDPGGEVLYLGSNAIRALVPLPDDLRGQGQVRVGAVRAWLRQHQDALSWDEARGQFELS